MVWVKIDDRFDEHPKMAAVGPLGIALWVTGLAYCNRNLTDGFIPRSVARTLIDWTHADGDGVEWAISVTRIGEDEVAGSGMDIASEDIIGSLLDAGVWERVRGGYLVHDYGDFQPTKAEIEQKQAAGRAGGRASAQARGRANGGALAEAGHQAESNPVPVPVPVPVPESEPEPPASIPFEELDQNDPIDAYMLITGRPPTMGAIDWINRLGSQYGKPRVAASIVEEWGKEPKIHNLLGRVEMGVATTKRVEDKLKPKPGYHDGSHGPECLVCHPKGEPDEA